MNRELDGDDYKQIRVAIMDAYPHPKDLEIMVAEELNRSLNAIVVGENIKQVVFDLIKWAKAHGNLKQLIEGACRGNPGNLKLQTINNKFFVNKDRETAKLNVIKPKQYINLGKNIEKINGDIIINPQQPQNDSFIEELGNSIEIEMIRIPGGNFIMGAPKTEEGSRDSERPQHQVTVSTFFMGKYPVTQAQWRAVASLPEVNRELQPKPSFFEGENRPVECVSWLDAVEFCRRLSVHTNKNYRLPSEAEWEYACRAGTTTSFHFGEIITSDLANYGDACTDRYSETTDVGYFGLANAFGLYDMHGNVCEWCADHWHTNYQGAPTDGSAWIDSYDNDNRSRVLRGGSWYKGSCHSAYRVKFSSDGREYNDGFRLVCDL